MVKRSIVALLGAACALVACPVDMPEHEQLDFACRLDEECAQGARCVGGRCQSGAQTLDASLDASVPEAAARDVTSAEAASSDAATVDVASHDLGPSDCELRDLSSPDAALINDAQLDSAQLDAAQPDSAQLDSAQLDASRLDTSPLDTSPLDATQLDAALPDAALPDAALPDAARPDAARPDAAQPDAFAVLCNLQAGDWSFTTPAPVTELNTEYSERDPVLSTDGLTIYINSSRPGGAGSADLWTATRADRDAPFSTPVNAAAFNSDRSESRITFTVDELQVFISTSREGGPGETDIWGARRAQVGDAFGALAPLDNINSEVSDHDPFVSVNGLRLYFATYGFTGSLGGQDVVVAARASTDEVFGAPIAIAEVNSAQGDADPALTFDERIMLFASRRHSDDTESDIYYATRAQIGDLFSTPQPLPVLNSDGNDGDPFITGDGCEIFFYTNRDGNGDVWRARYQAGP